MFPVVVMSLFLCDESPLNSNHNRIVPVPFLISIPCDQTQKIQMILRQHGTRSTGNRGTEQTPTPQKNTTKKVHRQNCSHLEKVRVKTLHPKFWSKTQINGAFKSPAAAHYHCVIVRRLVGVAMGWLDCHRVVGQW